MKLVRYLQRQVLRNSRLAFFRFLLWSHNAKRDDKVTEQFSAISRIPRLDIWESPILEKNRDKTLFILGSGSSINDLTEDQFAHISAHQSIGINFWFFHEFVPNVYSFDGGKVDEGHQNIRHTLETMGDLLNRQAILEARPKIVYLRPLNLDSQYLLPVPDELASNRWVSARANFISKEPRILESDLKLVLRKISSRQIPSSALPDNGSSVVRMIFLGLAQGFTRFVLTGVDLDDRPHFWSSEDYVRRYKEHVGLFLEQGGEPHGTTQAIDRPLGNVEFLALLGKVMREERAGDLRVSSPDSRLSPFLPQYNW